MAERTSDDFRLIKTPTILFRLLLSYEKKSKVLLLMLKSIQPLFLLLGVLFFVLCINPVFSAKAETLTQEKKVQEELEKSKKGNIFNMIFGAAPDMPTQRGLLLINAYYDENGNQNKDPTEKELRNEIVCRVDGIQYRIPAFIPALKLHENYRVECDTDNNSNSFSPQSEITELFVERRGQIFSIELPCKKLENKEPSLSGPPF
jgi:hypothetical protein